MEQNSHAEFFLGLYRAQLVDCALHYPELSKEFDRDYKRLCSACESHGVRFFLDTMPSFRKHLDKCLDEGCLTPSGLIHFGQAKRGAVIPRLFRGLTRRIFASDCSLRSDLDHKAVKLLRQLLGVVRKVHLPCKPADTYKSVDEFFETDLEVKNGELRWNSPDSFDPDHALELSFGDSEAELIEGGLPFDLPTRTPLPSGLAADIQLCADICVSQLGVFEPEDWSPRHGPGAVADARFGSYKYEFPTWSDRLETVFPYHLFALANFGTSKAESLIDGIAADVSHDTPAKLCAVPKTIKTPRLIACEPTSSQWCQQIIRDYFYSRVSDTVLGRFVDFRRQDLNGNAALEASRDGSVATIDLSSASDRVSCWAVERLFRRSPSLLEALWATRSQYIKQDICRSSPSLHRLRKFSTMGNATTFPVQSILFAVVALGCYFHFNGIAPSLSAMKRIGRGQVRVFGDDIVVPTRCSGLVVETLEALGLRVNLAKTFRSGQFRESCGLDAFDGHIVTSVNVLEVPRKAGVGSIVSSVDVHNNLAKQGFVESANFIRKTVEALGFRKIRCVDAGSNTFGWVDLYNREDTRLRTRYNRTLQVRQVLCLTPKVKEHRILPETNAGLLQYFIEAPNKVTRSISSIGHLARRPKTGLSLRWVPL